MRMVDADAKITALVYDEEPEEAIRVEMTIADLLDSYAEEGCPQNGGWISVKDKLPEEDGDYLAYSFGFVDRLRFADGVWWDYGDECQPGVVTYWMPLPEPPEEVSGDD